MEVEDRIKRIRNVHGLTQKELGLAVGFDDKTVDFDQYDEWRYNFPKYDTTQKWVKVPSQELSDALVEQFKDKLKDM